MPRKVIIVGAGVGGLSAAYWLRKAGIEADVLEASDRAGGRIVTLEREGDYLDVGAQMLHSSYRVGEALMTELGLRDQWIKTQGSTCYCVNGKEPWLDTGHAAYIPPIGPGANLSLYYLVLRHVLLGYRHELHTIDKATRLDAISTAEFFRNWPGETLNSYLLPLLSSVMNVATPEHTSVQHLLHILRITGFTETYGLPKGLQMFPDALATKIDVQYESPVSRLIEEGGRIVGVEMAGSGEIHRADHVILAVAPIHASALLPDHYMDQKQFFDSIIKTPQALPVLYLDRPLPTGAFGYMGDPRSAGYFWMASDGAFKVPEMVPSGKSAVILWSQYPHLNDLEKMSDAEVIRTALQEFPNLVPGASADWVEEAIVHRHAFSHPPYGPGAYEAVLDFKAKAENLQGVSFIGDVFGGAYIECSLRSAETAVARALKA